MRCDPRKRQQRKTAARKDRQAKALKHLLSNPKIDPGLKQAVYRYGFYHLPQTTKQQIMEKFG